MRLATYNVEWFNRLFDDQGRLTIDDNWSGRWDVTKRQQTDALGAVFQALDADAIMVIEAPDSSFRRDSVYALEGFAEVFGLRAKSALIGFANHTQQEIALMYDPDVMSARHNPLDGGPDNPRFDMVFPIDVDDDGMPDDIVWSKPPLEVEITPHGGDPFQIIGVHAKSKAPHGAQNDDDVMRISIENRRKQSAQCIWLRKRVKQHLMAETPLMVMGDFNDGPGLDAYEALFGRSSVEIVLGEGDGLQLFDPHAHMALGQRIGAMPSTSRFKKRDGPYLQALLDYIMVSPDIMAKQPDWQIWHPFDHPACYDNMALREALLLASDHFPVVIDLP